MATPSRARGSLFERWGRTVTRYKWLVVVTWLAGLAALLAAMIAFKGAYVTKFSVPGAESDRAAALLKARFPAQGSANAEIVFVADTPFDDPAIAQRIDDIVAQAKKLPGVSDVAAAPTISADGKIAFVAVQYTDATESQAKALVALVDRSGGDGLRIEAGGRVVEHAERNGLGSTELIGVSAAAIILLIAFGSIVAMGVPIVTALFSLGGSLAVIGIVARFMDMTEFTPSFASMIGLGVGIDYCLLVITRYREQLHSGHTVEESVTIAVNTSGRSVLFAGTVVIIAMLGLTLMGIPFIAAMGVAAAIVVVLSVLTALTLLPAVLAIVGTKVDALGVPMFRSTEGNHEGSVWFSLSIAIQRRPLWFIAGGGAILLVLAIPLFSMTASFTDAGNNAPSTHSRRAYDLLKQGFGVGFNGPLTIVADTQAGGGDKIDALVGVLSSADGVSHVDPPRKSPSGDTTVITVYPSTSPQDSKTNELVHRLREQVIPPVTAGAPLQVYVTGSTASIIDVSDKISSRMPLFFAMVIGLSFVVLTIVFRSLFVPLKAALMNLLSIGAAYGALVAVFQWGWLAGPLGVKTTGPIEVFLPMMMFAILFGLSMDYEVFLVSRIREEYLKGSDNSKAVAMGLSSTARVITSAALIMIAVFGSFILGDERVIKEFGFGLAIAIFLDATIVRLMLVPSFMELMGSLNWWLPPFLDRLIPNIDIEGLPREPETAAAAGGD
jgi:RND superfamily putative drug exporter